MPRQRRMPRTLRALSWRRCGRAIAGRGWGGRNWTVCCWPMRKGRCGHPSGSRPGGCGMCPCWTGSSWGWTLRPPPARGRMNAGSWWWARRPKARRRIGAPWCWPIARCRGRPRQAGRARRSARWRSTAQIALSPRSIRAGKWWRKFCVRSTHWCRSNRFMPAVVRWHGRSLWRHFMSRGAWVM